MVPKNGSVAEGLERQDCHQHSLGSKLTRVILLCPLVKTLYGASLCLVVLASSSKLKSYFY